MTVTFPFAKTDNCTQEFSSDIQVTGATLSSTTVHGLGTVRDSYYGSSVKPTTLISNSSEAQENTSNVQSSNVIPLWNLSYWQLTALRAINKLAKLPNDWDGYESRQPQRVSRARAVQLILAIEREQMPIPYVYPVPGGGIQFEWQTSTRELEIEILPDGSVEFLTVLEGNEMKEGCLSLDQVGEVERLVYWLIDE